MPIPSPFHDRTSALCTSYNWKEWSGYHAVSSYEMSHEREYLAFRHGAGLLDVSPLCKYEVKGPDAGRFLSYITVKDVTKLGTLRVTYLCWCDPRGHVLDDGTITRWDDTHYRLTSADPSYAWLCRNARGFDVEIEDSTAEIATLALQGPNSRKVLAGVVGAEVEPLRFFRAMRAQAGSVPVEITRTGYTGDLGYEIWMPAKHALTVWDALVEAGAPYGLQPAGLNALDVTRVEAGFILAGVDYTSARKAVIPSQRSTPKELGLGWAVGLEREPFIGQAALLREAREGARSAMVGLDIDWDELEHLYDAVDLPPDLCQEAWRSSIPIYDGVIQVGYASSGAWSPTLKKNLAIATVDAAHSQIGTELKIEWTVDHARKTVKATVVPRPFFDPERKRSNVTREEAMTT